MDQFHPIDKDPCNFRKVDIKKELSLRGITEESLKERKLSYSLLQSLYDNGGRIAFRADSVQDWYVAELYDSSGIRPGRNYGVLSFHYSADGDFSLFDY